MGKRGVFRMKQQPYVIRIRQYEAEKRKLRGLTPKEYEAEIKRLAEKYKI